jgi:Cupin
VPLATALLTALPPLIRMTPDTSFLENIQFIAREVDTDWPGAEIVLTRMADVIYLNRA